MGDFFSFDDLPDGWECKKLGEIISPSKEKIEPTEDSTLPYIGLEHIESNTSKIIGQAVASDAKSTKTVFHSGDVLYGKLRPYLNKVAIPDFDGVCSTDILVFNQNQIIDSRYLMRYLTTGDVVEYANRKSKGISLPRVSFESLSEILIPFPPLSEQQRIVARVEALLTQVNAARVRLSRVPLIMKKFRQAILAAACSGKLTEGWRESCGDIEPSTELFSKIQICINQEYLESCENAKKTGGRKTKDERKNKKSEKPVIDLPELPDTWNYYRLEDLSHLITDGTHVTPEYIDKGIPFLSVKNIRPFSFRLGNIKLISPEEHHSINQRCNPELYDILYTKVGSYGYAVQNKLEYPFSLFVSVALIKPVKEYFTSDYAEIVMNSPTVFEQAIDRISGSGTPDLHLIEIRDFRIPLPPLAEQYEIVRRVGMLFERADAFDQEVVAAGRRCERLTQAVLARAFAGKL